MNITKEELSKLKKDLTRIANKYGSPVKKVNLEFISRNKLKTFYPHDYNKYMNGYGETKTTAYVVRKSEYNPKEYTSYYNFILHECMHVIINNTDIPEKYIESIGYYETGEYKKHLHEKIDEEYTKYIDFAKNFKRE